jgi:hypothetical protein
MCIPSLLPVLLKHCESTSKSPKKEREKNSQSFISSADEDELKIEKMWRNSIL